MNQIKLLQNKLNILKGKLENIVFEEISIIKETSFYKMFFFVPTSRISNTLSENILIKNKNIFIK